jgi:integrase
MKGYFRRRGCTCGKKKCTCGAKWSFTIDIGIDPATGKRKQKTASGFQTKAAAEEAAAKLHVELSSGTYVNEQNATFKEFTQEWLGIYKRMGKGKKESTLRIRQHEIDKLMPYFGLLKIKDITRKRYQDALNDLRGKFADNTLKGIHATGRMIFEKAVELNVIKVDPTEYAQVPVIAKTVEDIEKENEVVKYLEKEELSLFLKTAKEKGLELDYIAFLTLAYTGMRIGELCALKWSDIDSEGLTINITKTCYVQSNILDYQLLTPKTISSIRKIEVDPVVISELEEYRKVQNIIRMKKRNSYHDQDFIFAKTGKNAGYPESMRTFEWRMTRILKLARLNPKLTPHSLRHTHTSLLAEADAKLEEIMERLGHRDDSTTKHVYMHVTQSRKKETAAKFSKLMRGI